MTARKIDKLIEKGQKHSPFAEGVKARGAIAAVGQTVRAMRERHGLSQAGLAERAAMHASEISRIEAGDLARGPTVDTLVRLAQACGENFQVRFGNPEDRSVVSAVSVHRPSQRGVIYKASHPLRGTSVKHITNRRLNHACGGKIAKALRTALVVPNDRKGFELHDFVIVDLDTGRAFYEQAEQGCVKNVLIQVGRPETLKLRNRIQEVEQSAEARRAK